MREFEDSREAFDMVACDVCGAISSPDDPCDCDWDDWDRETHEYWASGQWWRDLEDEKRYE